MPESDPKAPGIISPSQSAANAGESLVPSTPVRRPLTERWSQSVGSVASFKESCCEPLVALFKPPSPSVIANA